MFIEPLTPNNRQYLLHLIVFLKISDFILILLDRFFIVSDGLFITIKLLEQFRNSFFKVF